MLPITMGVTKTEKIRIKMAEDVRSEIDLLKPRDTWAQRSQDRMIKTLNEPMGPRIDPDRVRGGAQNRPHNPITGY